MSCVRNFKVCPFPRIVLIILAYCKCIYNLLFIIGFIIYFIFMLCSQLAPAKYIDTWIKLIIFMTLDRHLMDTQSMVDRLIGVHCHSIAWLQNSVDSWVTVDWDVDQMLIECQPRYRLSIDQLLIEGISRGYQSTLYCGCL